MTAGGYIPGPATTVTIEHAGNCRCGFPLYRIDGGQPEHILDKDMQWRYSLGMLACVDRFGHFTAEVEP